MMALASAAVPFAFPPVRLERKQEEYEFVPRNLTVDGYQLRKAGH